MIETSVPALPSIRAARIQLRQLTDADVPALLAIFSHPEVMRFWSRPAFADLDEAQRYLDGIRAGFAARALFQWGISRLQDDLVIGTCTLYELDASNGRAGIGYALHHEHWGCGLAAEAVDALLHFAFQALPLRRLEADVDPRNTRSIKLLERLGFKAEGLLRERWQVAGEITDSAIFGLLKHEWVPQP